jgi:hypothetical protein
MGRFSESCAVKASPADTLRIKPRSARYFYVRPLLMVGLHTCFIYYRGLTLHSKGSAAIKPRRAPEFGRYASHATGCRIPT